MPRLPDFQSQGEAPSLRSGRGIATYDTTAIGKGAQALGEGAQKLGRTLGNIADKQERTQDRLADGLAQSTWLAEKARLDRESADDSDPDGYEARWRPQYDQALDKARGHFRRPEEAELFRLKHAPTLEGVQTALEKRRFGLEKDRDMASSQEALANFGKLFREEQDPETRQYTLEGGSLVIEGLRERGYITDVQAQKMRQEWVENQAVEWYRGLPPREKLAVASGGFEGALIGSESGRNPRIVNGEGYVGLYQFGAPRLQDLGLYKPDDAKNWTKWAGTFAIPGFPQIRTIEDFRNSPAAQKAAFDLHIADIDREISARGLDKYIGESIGGATITKEAIYGMAHLGGIKGAERFLRSGGADNPGDSNGTRLSDYAKRFSGTKHVLADYLPGDRRRLAVEAGAEYTRELEKERVAARNAATALNVRIKDDLASMERTGTGLDIKREEVAAVLGIEGAAEWEDARARARRVHDALDGIEALPEGEVERRLNMLQPAPGSDGYAADLAAYDKARVKADKFLAARRSDPALAVEALPAVKEARAAAQYEGEGEERRIAPASAQSIVRARLAAQSQLGIVEPMAVTRSEGRELARQLRYIGDDDTKGLERFMRRLERTYGDLADEVLAATLQHAEVNRDLAVTATDVLGKLAAGRIPDISGARRLDSALEQQALDDAMRGRASARAEAAPAIDPMTGFPMPQAPARAATGQAKPAKGEFTAAPAPEDLRVLAQNRADPRIVALFEQHYGPGTAKRALDEVDRRLGARAAQKPQAAP